MIPGEIITAGEPIAINSDRPTVIIKVANSGDRPIQARDVVLVPLAGSRTVYGFRKQLMGEL